MIELLKNTNFLIIFFTLFFISTLVFWISIILKFSKKKKLSEADKKELKNIFKNMKTSKSGLITTNFIIKFFRSFDIIELFEKFWKLSQMKFEI